MGTERTDHRLMALEVAQRVLDHAPSAVVSIDELGVIRYWSPSAEALFGHAWEAAEGRTVGELIVPEGHRPAHEAGLARLRDTGESRILDRRIELTAVRADGIEFPVELSVTAMGDGSDRIFFAFIRDLTERRTAEDEHARLVRELRGALHGSERRFDAIVGALSDPVTIRDRSHHFLYANSAAVAYLGFDSWEELHHTSPDEIMADYQVFGEDGRDISMRDIPSVRILRGEPAEPLVVQTIHRRTGERRWDLLKSAPLLDESGRVEATIMIIQDVTERKRAEDQAAFLARAGDVLASSLDYEQTLRNVAQLAVPGIADWCAVDLIDEQGGRRSVAVAHVDPERVELAEQLRAYAPDELDPERGIGRVFATGEPVLYGEISAAMIEQAAVDERHLDLLRTIGFSSVMIVPVGLGERTLGAMTLVSAESGRVLDEFDLQLAQQVAARASVAIENSRLYSERTQIAHTLQQSLLPEELPEIPRYELATIYTPAIASSEVGGDFYDAWEIDDGWMIVIGDVTGKGIKAAALTSLVRHTMRAAADFACGPAQLLARVDRALKKQRALSICTALCLRLEGDRITLAVGGHPLPVCLNEDGARLIGISGPLLGAFTDVRWEELEFEISPGSSLVTYTDGVTDALGEDGSRYGQARLCATLEQCATRAAGPVVECLAESLDSFQAGGHADDTAVLVVHRLGALAAAGAPDASAERTSPPG